MEQYDDLNNYCRLLGHYIRFGYCRTQQHGLPCSKILDCHFERIPIQSFIDEHYSDEQKSGIFKQQPPKLLSIVELIEQARRRTA